MEADTARSAVHEVKPAESVTIPSEIAEALDSLPERNDSRKMVLEPWIDDALRQYWNSKRKADVAKMLGVSENVLRRRARELGL